MDSRKDLRVEKTKKNIVDSFISLLQKKNLEQISVTDICKLARCSRNTFYYHFPYKEALYDQVLNSFVDKIKNSMCALDVIPSENLDEFSEQYMYQVGEIVLKEKDTLFPILVGEHANRFFSKLTEMLRETIMANTEQVFPDAVQNGQYRLMCWYSASAIVGFLTGCIYDVDISKEKALDILCALHAPAFSLGVRLLQNES